MIGKTSIKEENIFEKRIFAIATRNFQSEGFRQCAHLKDTNDPELDYTSKTGNSFSTKGSIADNY